MKAILQYGPNDLRYEEIPYPQCEPGGMIMKVMAVGLCGSDIRNLTTDSLPGKYPHIWGHEHAGIIKEVGPEYKGEFKPGDRVIYWATRACGQCAECRAGNSNYCLNKNEYTFRQGGFAQYIPIPEVIVKRGGVVRLPDELGFEAYSVIEPMMSVNGCQQRLNINFRDTVLICGAGPLGCLHAKVAKIRGAKRVIMTEIASKRLEGVEKFGVDVKIDASKVDQIEEVLKLTGGRGADKVIVANPSTISQQQSLKMCKPGGIISFFGGVAKGAMTEIDSNIIHYKGLTIMGQTGGDALAQDTAQELVFSGRVDYREFITCTMPLCRITEAIAKCKAGEAIKIAMDPWMDENGNRIEEQF
ncbi:MAG: alcohol dehydrogenase catalytic domain-containing protein [Erysipelotrichaceae bacterium]|nr:alcohol dehydrogenase catalytic domain-containing protein [Erysipelotrichaceae bacterium]